MVRNALCASRILTSESKVNIEREKLLGFSTTLKPGVSGHVPIVGRYPFVAIKGERVLVLKSAVSPYSQCVINFFIEGSAANAFQSKACYGSQVTVLPGHAVSYRCITSQRSIGPLSMGTHNTGRDRTNSARPYAVGITKPTEFGKRRGNGI
jgi:hypothetical protein